MATKLIKTPIVEAKVRKAPTATGVRKLRWMLVDPANPDGAKIATVHEGRYYRLAPVDGQWVASHTTGGFTEELYRGKGATAYEKAKSHHTASLA